MFILNRENRMEQKLYGLTQSGNRFFYSIGNKEAYAIQIKPFPAAWKKTPSTPWNRTHTGFLHLDNLGLSRGPSGLELDPIAEFDRAGVNVFRLVPSNSTLEYEPYWDDSIPFAEWEADFNWRETVANLMAEINPVVLEKLRRFSHFHLNLLEALHEWPGFEDRLERNPVLAACLAGRIRVGGQKGERRSRLDYGSLMQCSQREIAAALGFGDSDEVLQVLRKLPPDVCKPHGLMNLPDLLENSATRRALIDADVISHPALALLRSPSLSTHLAGSFLSEVATVFPHSLDILTCSWGPLLRGGSNADYFMEVYRRALVVVESDQSVVIDSIGHLRSLYTSL